jgi:hypothetical protein
MATMLGWLVLAAILCGTAAILLLPFYAIGCRLARRLNMRVPIWTLAIGAGLGGSVLWLVLPILVKYFLGREVPGA